MRTFLSVVLVMAAATCLYADYDCGYVNDQLEQTLVQIRQGNTAMHWQANEWASAAARLGCCVPPEKIQELRNYLEKVRPHRTHTDRR